MRDECVTILENKKINGAYWKLTFSSQALARRVRPGQFVNVRIDDQTEPFLRRPFSYYRTKGRRVELLYEILGRGTLLLTRKKSGDTLRVAGPLGRWFNLAAEKKKRVLVAGGVGVPPLVFLAEQERTDYLLIGCRSKSEVLPKQELTKIKARIDYATEDGSYGQRGLVTQLLKKIIEREGPERLFIQTCGPHAMMQAVMRMARAVGIMGEASIDERMACGVGACLGCVVQTVSGFKTSCVEGPVFRFEELVC